MEKLYFHGTIHVMAYNTTIALGAQFGDEGKGKIVDFLAKDAKLVIRYGGGPNAGHTICIDGQTFKLRVVPSGIFNPKTINVIGNGLVIDLKELLEELTPLISANVNVDNLFISECAHVIFPYHKLIDSMEESAKGEKSIGTTLRGIGPTYKDKIARQGIRLIDLKNPKIFKEKLENARNNFIKTINDPGDYFWDNIFNETNELFSKIVTKTVDTVPLINSIIDSGGKTIFEGAQGTFLDIDHGGSYPYVTSSSPTAGGACTGTGVGPTKIKEVLGITKAYTTRVGSGPFVTELVDGVGKLMGELGQEYGTVTGRKRRCGWLDLVALKRAAQINGLTSLAITKMDIANQLPYINVCTSYVIDGKTTQSYPNDIESLEKAKPVYETFKTWNSIKNKTLPEKALDFIKFIENAINVPCRIVSIGPERNDTIDRWIYV